MVVNRYEHRILPGSIDKEVSVEGNEAKANVKLSGCRQYAVNRLDR